MAVDAGGSLQVRGVALRSFLDTVAAVWGPTVRAAVVAHLPPGPREAIPDRILSGQWYPLSWQESLHRSLQSALVAGPSVARRLGYEGVRRDLRGPFAVVLRWLSPRAAAQQSALVWGKYYSAGRVQVVAESPRAVSVRFSDCPGFSESLWENVHGGLQALMEGTGVQHVRVHRTWSGEGSADFRVLWVPRGGREEDLVEP